MNVTVDIWTCDRCGHEARLAPESWPEGWGDVRILPLNPKAPHDAGGPSLCGPCCEALHEFLRPVGTVTVEAMPFRPGIDGQIVG